ncbi:MAG: sterol desaturase family protein, partial [Alphaproteobacteria bacterium]
MTWDALWNEAIFVVALPVLGFWMPWKIYYWVFFLSAAAIAVIANVVARPLREFSLQAMCRAALNPRIWLAKSARADYRFWIVNGILFPLVAVPTTVTAIGLGLVIAQGLAAILGPIEAPVMGPMAIRVAYSITFFVMLDFGHYVAHIASHKIPLLWEFHKVHHSAEVLTPITSSRFHPIDLYILNTGRGVGAAIATGIFYYLGAGEVTLSMVFGAHVAVTAYQVIGNLRHSHVWVSYGPLNHILVSPAMHQIHHTSSTDISTATAAGRSRSGIGCSAPCMCRASASIPPWGSAMAAMAPGMGCGRCTAARWSPRPNAWGGKKRRQNRYLISRNPANN